MAICKISAATAASLYETRSLTGYDRKSKKKGIISQIKRDLGIPSSKKIKINILNPDSPEYLIVRDKRTGQALTNNLPEPVVALPAATEVSTVATEAPTHAVATKKVPAVATKKAPAAPAAATKAPLAKKLPAAKPLPVAKSAPAKKTAPAAKPIGGKKPPAVTKAASKPATTAKELGSKTKTGKYTIEVRPSISGTKVRLGYASSEAEKAKMIAAHKAKLG